MKFKRSKRKYAIDYTIHIIHKGFNEQYLKIKNVTINAKWTCLKMILAEKSIFSYEIFGYNKI